MHKRRRNLQLLAVTFALLSTLILPITLPNQLSTLLSPGSAQNQWFGLRLKEKSPEPLVLNAQMRFAMTRAVRGFCGEVRSCIYQSLSEPFAL